MTSSPFPTATAACAARRTAQLLLGCGTPLLWEKSDGPYADWVAFPLATLDTPVRPLKQKHIHVASKAP